MGPVKAGEHAGIQIVVCAEDQVPSSFVLTFERYSVERERRYREGVGFFAITSESEVSLGKDIFRAIGDIEELS